MKIFIKNMVCIRCKMVVKSELDKLGICNDFIELGEVQLKDNVSSMQLYLFNTAIKKYGLELIDDKKSILVEKIKAIVLELVHFSDDQIKTNLSEYLSNKLNHSYSSLSNLFSEVYGTTIEQFYLAHKIERVKELIVYDELTLSEIAFKMHYSSAAHLSNQFKKWTGLTPSHFKKLKIKRRTNLEDV
jgi:AraC-like DNA-binding protein